MRQGEMETRRLGDQKNSQRRDNKQERVYMHEITKRGFNMCARFTIKYLAYLMLLCIPAYSTILMRNTFEEYEGETPQECDWTVSTNGVSIVQLEGENPANLYQTQSHGVYSLRIYDPNRNSYVSSSRTFSNSASEYMVEFYILIRSDHATIDFFSLCVLWNVVIHETLRSICKTDIALQLNTVDTSPDGYPFTIHVEDADSLYHNVAYIDSVDRWYKIQIYRHNGDVDFYLDGEFVGTYNPMNPSCFSNKIAFGTTNADSLANGEVFYDDVIVSTPPSGDHPRLLFEDGYLPTLKSRRTGGATYLGATFTDIWDRLKTYASHFISDSNSVYWRRNSIEETYEFPYPQFAIHSRENTNLELWLGPQRIVGSALLGLAFVSLVDTDDTIRNYAESLLVSLSHWQTWNDPYFHRGAGERYIQLGVGHFMYGVALAYDWLYNSLSSYERLSIQNTLINLGINQCFLEIKYGTWGKTSKKWPNAAVVMIGGMAIGCLALDECGLEVELDTATARIDDLLNDQDVCDSTGGFAEGVSYGGYAVDYLVTFAEAADLLSNYISDNKFLGTYPDWRVWCMLPGAEDYYSEPYYQSSYWDITFCDYDKRGGRWTTAIARLADLTDNSEARWFLNKRKDSEFTDEGFNRWELYLPMGLFIWVEENGTTCMPAPDTLLKVFDGIGWAIVRTGWQDTDYLLALKSGQRLASHNHHEQGSFIFGGKGRWLIADMGYPRKSIHKRALYHNVLYEANSESLYWCSHTLSSHFSTDTTNGEYSYIQSVGKCNDGKIGLWTRKIVFFNKLGSFGIMDYAEENQEISSLSWRVHTWAQPVVENDSIIRISYSNGPHLLCNIISPRGITITDSIVKSVSYREKTDTSMIRYDFHQINAILPTENLDMFRVIVGFAPYENQNSVEVITINGINFEGARLKNDRGCAAVLFGISDSTVYGRYEISVRDSLLNVVCNLVPDVCYLVTTKKDIHSETIDTLKTNSAGVLSFKIAGAGDWEVMIALGVGRGFD